MSKFKRIKRIIDGKIIEIEIGHNTLQYVLTKRLTGMRFFGTKKHKLKIKNSIRRANTKNLKHKGFSDEEIKYFQDYLESVSHIIIQLAREGGFEGGMDNASSF